MTNDKEFNFKGKLQEIIERAMKDPLIMKAYINIFNLYSRLYVEPHMEQIMGNFEVDIELFEEKLVPKQLEIFDSMINDQFTAVFGSRKTGKTYLMALGIILLGTDRPMKVHVLSSKKDTAAYLITMMAIIAEEFDLDIFHTISAEKCRFYNGTTVKIHANTLADTGTYEADLLILDEAQEIDENVWGKIMPQLATGRDMYIWIMGTAKAGTMFYTFWTEGGTKFKKFELHMSDATKSEDNPKGWVTTQAWLDIMSVMPERMIRQELYLKWVEPEGAYFNADAVGRAFKEYEIYAKKDYDEIICPVDWGWGHEHAMYVLGIKDGIIYELESWSMQNAPRATIIRKFEEFHRKYRPLFILEGGQLAENWIGFELDEKNIDFMTSVFSNVKEIFWGNLDFVLDDGRIMLDNYVLKKQLLRYCGDKKEDDHVDSLLHGVRYYVIKHLQKYYDNWFGDD